MNRSPTLATADRPADRAAAPLLMLCAIGPERWALRGGNWSSAGSRPGAAVLGATGMGPERARAAAGALLAHGSQAYGALLVTGFCGALAPGIRSGAAFVAEEVRDARDAIDIPSCGVLADVLGAQGLTVHRGALYSADRVVRGDRRARLHADGAAAVDMETAAVLRTARELAPELPVAAARIVLDTPQSELLRPGTVWSGAHAWRALRSAVPAFAAWYGAVVEAAAPQDRAASQPIESPHRTLPQEAS